jgi:hypothetical protein
MKVTKAKLFPNILKKRYQIIKIFKKDKKLESNLQISSRHLMLRVRIDNP